jgi:hypothetical protein
MKEKNEPTKEQVEIQKEFDKVNAKVAKKK